MPDADWVKYMRLRGQDLPAVIRHRGADYALARVFKHDFYAATGLYQGRGDGDPSAMVLKVYHADRLGPLPLGWLGRWLCRRESKICKALDGIDGVPRFLGRYGPTGLLREFVPGCNLRELRQRTKPDAQFFPRLCRVLDEVHRRGVAHSDLSKPENVLVRTDGRPVLIDFQIAVRSSARNPLVAWLRRRLVRALQRTDRYHLRKNHRRARPEDFTAAELQACRRKGVVLTLHDWLLRRPYRAVRHFVLRRFLTKAAEGATK